MNVNSFHSQLITLRLNVIKTAVPGIVVEGGQRSGRARYQFDRMLDKPVGVRQTCSARKNTESKTNVAAILTGETSFLLGGIKACLGAKALVRLECSAASVHLLAGAEGRECLLISLALLSAV